MTISKHMSKEVFVVSSESTIEEMTKLFEQHRISGAPVVDREQCLVGVVSLSDLSRQHTAKQANEVAYYANPSWGQIHFPVSAEEEKSETVKDIMTNLVISADAEDDLERAADLMVEHSIHRVIVTSAGKVVGVLSSFDLVKEFRRQMKAAKQLR